MIGQPRGPLVLCVALAAVIAACSTSAAPTPTPTIATQPAQTSATVLVAAVNIPLGTSITQDMVISQTIDASARPSGAANDITAVVGKWARTAIPAGHQITSLDLTEIPFDLGPIPGTSERGSTLP